MLIFLKTTQMIAGASKQFASHQRPRLWDYSKIAPRRLKQLIPSVVQEPGVCDSGSSILPAETSMAGSPIVPTHIHLINPQLIGDT
jgi:hypothetical protein